VTLFKLVTKNCTCGIVCITLNYGALGVQYSWINNVKIQIWGKCCK